MEMGHNMRYGIADFSEVAGDFDILMKTLLVHPDKIIYVKQTGLFESRINAQNIIALADPDYRTFTRNNEYFGLIPDEAWRIERYVMLDYRYDIIMELHKRYPQMDKEHGSFMKLINNQRRVRGAPPMDKNGKVMDRNSEEYKQIMGL